jgi:hypothetical protein
MTRGHKIMNDSITLKDVDGRLISFHFAHKKRLDISVVDSVGRTCNSFDVINIKQLRKMIKFLQAVESDWDTK